MEFSQFLESTLKRDICPAIPDDVIDLERYTFGSYGSY